MRLRPLFAWYDLWVGAFWDRKARKLYILPLPCIGFVIEFTTEQGDNLTERDKKVIAYWRSLGWNIPRTELSGEALDNFLRKIEKP